VTGYVATQPRFGFTRAQVPTFSMRVGWTPRRRDQKTGDWADEPSSFATVLCYRKVAEHAAACVRKGDPIVVKGTLRTREFEDAAGVRRVSVDVLADSIGHDLSRGISLFTRSHAQLAQTALERYQQEHGSAWPRPDGEPGLAGPGQEDPAVGEPERAHDMDPQGPEQADLEPAPAGPAETETPDDELFDEDEAIEVLEGAEPVSAPS